MRGSLVTHPLPKRASTPTTESSNHTATTPPPPDLSRRLSLRRTLLQKRVFQGGNRSSSGGTVRHSFGRCPAVARLEVSSKHCATCISDPGASLHAAAASGSLQPLPPGPGNWRRAFVDSQHRVLPMPAHHHDWHIPCKQGSTLASSHLQPLRATESEGSRNASTPRIVNSSALHLRARSH